jgi:hypothetical protein
LNAKTRIEMALHKTDYPQQYEALKQRVRDADKARIEADKVASEKCAEAHRIRSQLRVLVREAAGHGCYIFDPETAIDPFEFDKLRKSGPGA